MFVSLHTPEDRFRDKYFEDVYTGCFQWIGATDGCWGYGCFWSGEKKVKSHRFAWEQAYGPIPDGKIVCHQCDNPGCVNVNHLFLGTDQDNADDKYRKGRGYHPSGEDHRKSVLNFRDVEEIRRLSGIISHRKLAKIFGVKGPAIWKIIHHVTWKQAA